MVEDGVVSLTDREGKPALDDSGYRYSKKLAEGENAKTIAGRLTRELRLALRGRCSGAGLRQSECCDGRSKVGIRYFR